jgi:hypothetical protein
VPHAPHAACLPGASGSGFGQIENGSAAPPLGLSDSPVIAIPWGSGINSYWTRGQQVVHEEPLATVATRNGLRIVAPDQACSIASWILDSCCSRQSERAVEICCRWLEQIRCHHFLFSRSDRTTLISAFFSGPGPPIFILGWLSAYFLASFIIPALSK